MANLLPEIRRINDNFKYQQALNIWTKIQNTPITWTILSNKELSEIQKNKWIDIRSNLKQYYSSVTLERWNCLDYTGVCIVIDKHIYKDCETIDNILE